MTQTRVRIRTVEELDNLPTHAVVESADNCVFQKLTTNPGWPEPRWPAHLARQLPYGDYWFRPGSRVQWRSEDIELPAVLFDDGL